MAYACKPDFDRVLDRYEAWWDAQVLDRALVSIAFRKPAAQCLTPPPKTHGSILERWLDCDYQADRIAAHMANTVWYADSLPVCYPNLGPEIFSAFYGCELKFTETTSWSVPILKDLEPESLATLRLDRGSFWFRQLDKLTDAFLERGRGKYLVGYTDLHPGGDAIAAFREPEELCVDLLEYGDAVKALVDRITTDFLDVYDYFHAKLSAAGMHSTTWLPGTCRGKYHVPSNDFSCTLSERLFADVFLPGIARECAHMDRSIYHLDGPDALRFLPLLLDVPKLHAIQWVPGAGRDDWHQWVPVYRQIQAAGKAFYLHLDAADLDEFMGLLRPEGAWLILGGISTADAADAVLRKVAKWGTTKHR